MTNLKIEAGLISVLKAINNKIHFALGEFVDNSIQSFIENKEQLEKETPGYKPKIEIIVEDNNIYVKDNCGGISKENEERAFSLASANPNIDQIGTFGMGMKVSACWFSDNWSVETKAINENVIKTYKVDVDKVASGKMGIGPTTKKSDGRSFTKIHLSNCHERTIPHSSQVSITKRHISDIYRFFIQEGVVAIYYNDELLTFERPSVKVSPVHSDQIKIQQGNLKEENAESHHWHAYIDRIDMGKNKNGKLWAEGEVWLREKGLTTGQRGFGIFWKNRLMEGVSGDPWMPGSSSWQFEDIDDDKNYGIYGGENRGRNQRLEGFLHVSPNFNKSFQTNKLDWESKDIVLAEKLKSVLHEIYLRDDQTKSFDILHQAEYGIWKKITPRVPGNPPSSPPIGEDPGVDTPIPIPEPPDDPPRPIDPIGPEDTAKRRNFMFNGITYDTTIYMDESNSDDFITHNEGPSNTPDETTKSLGIRINIGHVFVQKYFKGGNGDDEMEGLIRFGVAFVLAQEISKANKAKNKARNVLPIFEQIIKNPDF